MSDLNHAGILAFSDGPVSLEDILKVKGKKFNPSTPELQQRESTEDRERKRAPLPNPIGLQVKQLNLTSRDVSSLLYYTYKRDLT